LMTSAWLAVIAAALVGQEPSAPVRVGSKTFTESVILGEMATLLLEDADIPAVHRRELGGTRVLFDGLVAGELDIYPEYTGTITGEILAGQNLRTDEALRAVLAERGIRMSPPLGFDDTYAIGMREDIAERLGIRKLSNLRGHPELKLGFSNEFMERIDGWPGLRDRYGLPQRDVRGLDHDLAYRAIASGEIDATELYSTDAEIRAYHLRILDDDLKFFPPYRCVWLYRADMPRGALEALGRLEGRISTADMAAMNARAKLDRVSEPQVAADFLADRLGLRTKVVVEGRIRRLLRRLGEHLALVGLSMVAAIVVAIPLGILAACRPGVGSFILAIAGIIQTIPSLAMLVFMIPWLGIGAKPALVALFLYSLLPIVRNTATGLRGIPPSLRESSEALGLPPLTRLIRIELPMASRSIMAGIKTAAVINVGTATIGALIGAGGFGQPILTGLRRNDPRMILLEGAIPAAVLAMAVQTVLDVIEWLVVPRGLRS
ncbi:MAG: ABC transporter permease/substrate-binding protein, partial [Isosphaeraceae bacterium]